MSIARIVAAHSQKAHVIMTGQSLTDTTSKKNAFTAPSRNLTACHATNC